MVSIDSKTIELRGKWNIGPEIAEGGFGKIYEAKGEDGLPAVIKLVRKVPGASRELLFEPVSGFPNIIPILDSGEWGDYYVLVMPRAEKSLRQHLDEAGGKLTMDESLRILIDVAEALAGLQQNVVHRDLKPNNILLYQGRWCLADFGIARYAEATTAPDTHKHARTAPYAAPEQWLGERATPATDVYAFGVTAFELLQGHRPYPGPDYRHQHVSQTPPTLPGCPPVIAALVTECLYKPAQTRPTSAVILTRIRRSQQPPSPAAARLQAVNQIIVEKQAQAGAIASAQKSTEEWRKELFHTARQSLERILDGLHERIRDEAPAATVARLTYLDAELGKGRLSVESIQPTPPKCLSAFGAPPIFDPAAAFDVIAHTAISVRKPRDQYNYEGRSHSLWFCDAYDEGIYRWFEIAFTIKAYIPLASVVNPFALSPTDKEGASRCQIAREPLPFDQGDEEQFMERWLGWFAAAVDGTLHMPLRMPEDSGGHHRR